MRSGIAIFLIALLVSTSSKEIVHFVIFKLNQDSISLLFCINKNKPELKCDGKCYLKKAIEKATTEQDTKPMPPPDEKSPVVLTMILLPANPERQESKSSRHFFYKIPLSSCLYSEIPHPPEAIS